MCKRRSEKRRNIQHSAKGLANMRERETARASKADRITENREGVLTDVLHSGEPPGSVGELVAKAWAGASNQV